MFAVNAVATVAILLATTGVLCIAETEFKLYILYILDEAN